MDLNHLILKNHKNQDVLYDFLMELGDLSEYNYMELKSIIFDRQYIYNSIRCLAELYGNETIEKNVFTNVKGVQNQNKILKKLIFDFVDSKK